MGKLPKDIEIKSYNTGVVYIVEKVFDYKGYTCVVVFELCGWRCGYVAVPKDNKLYGKHYDGYYNVLECHHGVTYSDNDPNYPIPNEDLWWFGFDCAHLDDAIDIELIEQIADVYPELEKCAYIHHENGTVKDTEFVIENCKLLVDSIIKYNEGNTYLCQYRNEEKCKECACFNCTEDSCKYLWMLQMDECELEDFNPTFQCLNKPIKAKDEEKQDA